MSSETLPTLWPDPRHLHRLPGSLRLSPSDTVCVIGTGHGAQVLGKRLRAPIMGSAPAGRLQVVLRLVESLDLPADVTPDLREEAYALRVAPDGVTIEALTDEGLLRGAATLLQLLQDEDGRVTCPCVEILDWPFFRFRCAADWLVNVECNRWAYDWGDGVEACVARMERKLDMCFAYKINQVWFDGFGWSLDRTLHYLPIVQRLTRYARERGIRLTFAGYGGGYGTSYQRSELYRAGYQGKVFVNRRPYPDGEEYLCCGLPGYDEARRYGTCLSNIALQEAKIEEMVQFVSAVKPGFVYVHDIDAGHLSEAHQAWLMRCDECRRQFPSDEMANARGHAGAMAAWCRRLIDGLHGVEAEEDYNPPDDLSIVFTSPVYTQYQEPGQPEVWQAEVEYFRCLSALIGPAPGVMFGLREQFLDPDGSPRITQLRSALDAVGNGHGALVISFLGGDCYLSDELVNASCCLAHLFEGARSVCLSNGGLHEEPLQLLNARALWSGPGSGFSAAVESSQQAETLAKAVVAGEHRPESVFGPDGALNTACRLLWGAEAGRHMAEAYRAGGGLEAPVGRIWWTITREVRRLRGDLGETWLTWEQIVQRWERRVEVTRQALEHVEAARAISADEAITHLTNCLALGARFAGVVLLAARLRAGDAAGSIAGDLAAELESLEADVKARGLVPTDLLGGDSGCWLETVELLREVGFPGA